MLDRCGALVLLVLLAPVLLAIAGLVKLTSPGPVFFTQLREGQHGRSFRIFKFRTMHTAACDASGVEQTTVGDERITPLGSLLRRSNLDELPQLINVLRGEMSFIGPRPHPFNMLAAGRRYDEHVSYYGARLLMRPGISGWAQCNGFRGPTTDPLAATARIDHDVAYIQNFSLLVDLRAIWKTLAREVTGGTGL
jgi:lipopolysaccharide/colanic/teichoic acid biosynthesis glycosyltransferase